MLMFWIITLIAFTFIGYLVIKDPTIVNKSISYSYYEDRETAVIWGSFSGIMGMLIAFAFPSPLTLIAGIALALVPIFGNFNKKPITYIHYGLALTFYTLMLFYTGAFLTALPYVTVFLIMQVKRFKYVSTFWLEAIGILVILIELYITNYV